VAGGARKYIILFQSSLASPACTSDESSMKMELEWLEVAA
jgi:hypothetical protein